MECYCWESIGESAESLLGLSGTVLMAGSRAVYCEMENRTVFLVHDAEYGIVPFGIGVSNISDLMQRADIERGVRVSTSRNSVDFSRVGIRIMRGLQKVECTGDFDELKSPADIRNNIVLMKNLIARYGSCKGLGPMTAVVFLNNIDKETLKYKFNVFCRSVLPSVQKLTDAIKADEKVQITDAVSRIAGLGPGLTPSGDDFLVGYLLTLSYADRIGLEVPRGYQTLKDIFLNGIIQRVPVISNAYLKSAAGGKHFSIIDDVLQVLMSRSDKEIAAPIHRMLRIGSSSGTDIMCGIIWSLQTLPYILRKGGDGND